MEIDEMIEELKRHGYIVFESESDVRDYADELYEDHLVFQGEDELIDYVRANYWPNTVFTQAELIESVLNLYEGEVIESFHDRGYVVVDPKDKGQIADFIRDHVGEEVIRYAQSLGFLVFGDYDELSEFIQNCIEKARYSD